MTATAFEMLTIVLLGTLVIIALKIHRQFTATREMLQRKLTAIVGTLQAPEREPALKDLRDNERALAAGRLNGENMSEDSKRNLASLIDMKREEIEKRYGEGFRN